MISPINAISSKNSTQSFGAKYTILISPKVPLSRLFSEMEHVCEENLRVYKGINRLPKKFYEPQNNEVVIQSWKNHYVVESGIKKLQHVVVYITDSANEISLDFQRALIRMAGTIS